MRKLFVMSLCTVAAVALLTRSASAVPPFAKVFTAEYVEGNDNAEFVAAVKKVKCNLCHEGKSKKMRNDYGKELSKLLDKKADAKNVEKIKEALGKVAAMKKGDSDQTYGDLIKAGKLPGGN